MLLWNKSQLDLLTYESTCCQAVRRLYKKKKNYSEILAVRIFVLLLSMNYIKYQIHNLMGIVANVLKKTDCSCMWKCVCICGQKYLSNLCGLDTGLGILEPDLTSDLRV